MKMDICKYENEFDYYDCKFAKVIEIFDHLGIWTFWAEFHDLRIQQLSLIPLR